MFKPDQKKVNDIVSSVAKRLSMSNPSDLDKTIKEAMNIYLGILPTIEIYGIYFDKVKNKLLKLLKQKESQKEKMAEINRARHLAGALEAARARRDDYMLEAEEAGDRLAEEMAKHRK